MPTSKEAKEPCIVKRSAMHVWRSVVTDTALQPYGILLHAPVPALAVGIQKALAVGWGWLLAGLQSYSSQYTTPCERDI